MSIVVVPVTIHQEVTHQEVTHQENHTHNDLRITINDTARLARKIADIEERMAIAEYNVERIRLLPLMTIISTISAAILGFYAREERNGAKVSNIISGIFGAALGVSLTAMGCMWRKMDSGY